MVTFYYDTFFLAYLVGVDFAFGVVTAVMLGLIAYEFYIWDSEYKIANERRTTKFDKDKVVFYTKIAIKMLLAFYIIINRLDINSVFLYIVRLFL